MSRADFDEIWRRNVRKADEDSRTPCVFATEFKSKVDEVIFTPLTDGQTLEQIAQAKYTLQEEYHAWRRSVPEQHMRTAGKHQCVAATYEYCYDQLHLLQLRLRPPLTLTAEPSEPAPPAPSETPRYCLTCGADVNTSSQNIPPVVIHKFLVAIEEGDIETVEQALCQEPRLANSRDDAADPETPLHYAVRCNDAELRVDITHLLLTYGAAVNAITPRGRIGALHVACQQLENLPVIKLLVEHGANIHARTRSRETPMQIALLRQEEAYVSYLAVHDVDNTPRGNEHA